MNFINIIYKLPDPIKNIYRNIENNKITRNIWSIKLMKNINCNFIILLKKTINIKKAFILLFV